ncbi:MAG: hypothetical protein COU29_03410 [Candidatus Magasanikbacteria bacterium CG10_big_fil_rev_8_21_14_0_10_36_32]|uniref:Glycosyltransferase 2-like domain-containing protein n=1 Tax=Candidatus Magasanikbacteria bacterium CG10_big_fil_rev_8_21_14_0_10_36_32 TaxID=1974646 RepID=A0A2M6W674_9BACT|nr:MAG: hypothetical protein COU29_03410 [Candidatus Magasanikbacteria bacterium CG10_big_fil_rev_8_21_14_0_10_36_32]
MKKLSVNLVIKNGIKYIPFFVASLKDQTYKDFELIFVDNASTDGTRELLEKTLTESGIEWRGIYNSENVGFAAGHNQAYHEVTTPYFMLLNADTYLMPDAMLKAVTFFDTHPETVSVSPRLMRWNFEKSLAGFQTGADILSAAQLGFTSQIDAIGIRLFRNRRAVEWLTRQEWTKDSASLDVQKNYNKQVVEVFGVSGALAFYRKSVIQQVLLPGDNMFDPTYHSYKEDLDLAYRLRNAGYVSYVLLDTVVYHDRTGAGPKKMGDWSALRNKSNQSYFVRFHSYKNHLRTLYKNEYWQNLMIDGPFIFWYEFKKLIYLLLINPRVVFLGWSDIIKHRKYTRQARMAIVNSRKLYWKGLRRWWL